MNGTKFFACNIIIWLIVLLKLLVQAEKFPLANSTFISFNKTRSLKIFPGVKCFIADNETSIHVRIHDLLRETEVQAPRSKQKKGLLQKLGFMMIMTPFIMQILSLPGAIATIKMSLLRSIIVAQLAIAIMIYNLIRSSQNSDVVIIHQPYYRKHYKHGYPSNYNDEDEWFGR